MGRWNRRKRSPGGRRGRRTDRADEAENVTTSVEAVEADGLSEAASTGDGDATELPTDAIAEDSLLDELSFVFADEAPPAGSGGADRPTRTEPPDEAPEPAVTSGTPDGAPDVDVAETDVAETDVAETDPADVDVAETDLAGDEHGRDDAAQDPVDPPDPATPPVVAPASAADSAGATSDVTVQPLDPERPSLVDPGLVASAPAGPSDPGEPSDAGDETGHTIQIGDQDLPEIRYLDEELGSSSAEGGPVVIDDDDTDDAIVASEATGRVDGRMRQRRIRVRRAEGRRRLHWVIIGAGVFVAAIAVLGVLASSLFSVNQITVVGNRYADPDALKAVILDLDGTPVLLVDTTAVEEELEAIPWVEDARVSTSFPNSATIEIRERVPVAAMPGADGLTRVLDKDGRVLDLIEGQPIALVWISGPITLDIPAGHFASPGPTWASALVPKFTPSIRPRVESMQVTPDGSDLRLYLRPSSPAPTDEAGEGGAPGGQPALLDGPLIEVRFGSAVGDNQQIAKLVRLERVLEDIGTKRVSLIDVSTAEVTVL